MMSSSAIALLDGGERLHAIAQIIGDPNNSFEIKAGKLELGDLDQYSRFILDNRPVWNTLRALPADAIKKATIVELRAAYSAIMSICDTNTGWDGSVSSGIEGLESEAAIQIVQELLTTIGSDCSVQAIPELIRAKPLNILSLAIWRAATEVSALLGLQLSHSYHAAFVVDARSIDSRDKLFCALPLLTLGALTTADQNVQTGLDITATRNGYATFNEFQESMFEKFHLETAEWYVAAEIIETELAGQKFVWEKLSLLRRLVRRYRYSITATSNGI